MTSRPQWRSRCAALKVVYKSLQPPSWITCTGGSHAMSSTWWKTEGVHVWMIWETDPQAPSKASKTEMPANSSTAVSWETLSQNQPVKLYLDSSSFFLNYIFIYFWLPGSSLLQVDFLQLHEWGKLWCASFSRLESVGSVIAAHGSSCPEVCGIFPERGLNSCPLHWQVDSWPLDHQESPEPGLLILKNNVRECYLPLAVKLWGDLLCSNR